jgi:hypothetical protein
LQAVLQRSANPSGGLGWQPTTCVGRPRHGTSPSCRTRASLRGIASRSCATFCLGHRCAAPAWLSWAAYSSTPPSRTTRTASTRSCATRGTSTFPRKPTCTWGECQIISGLTSSSAPPATYRRQSTSPGHLSSVPALCWHNDRQRRRASAASCTPCRRHDRPCHRRCHHQPVPPPRRTAAGSAAAGSAAADP